MPCTARVNAAELIRRKSLTTAGLEEIRNIAGLESLIKLVDEGLPAEKVLWIAMDGHADVSATSLLPFVHSCRKCSVPPTNFPCIMTLYHGIVAGI